MRSFLHVLTFMILILPIKFTSAQDSLKIDSLIRLLDTQEDTTLLNTYEEIILQILPKNPKNAKPYLDQALVIVKESKSSRHHARWTRHLGLYYYYIADYKEAKLAFIKAGELFDDLGDKDALSKIYNNLGIIENYMGHPKKALEAHLHSLRLKEELNQGGYALAASYLNIGNLYGEMKEVEKSNQYYFLAEEIFIEEEDEYRLSVVRSNLAVNMELEGKTNEALDYYLSSLPYFIKNGYRIEEAKQYNLIGALYFGMDSLSEAETYFLKAETLSQELKETQIEELSTRNLGDIYFTRRQYRKSLENFERALYLSNLSGTESRRVNTYLRLADTHEALGNFEQVNEFRKLHFEQYDRVFKKEKIDQLNELEIQYQTEKKEQQIALQEKEIQLLEEEARVNTLNIIAITLTLILALLGIYALLLRMKRNKLEKQKLDAELEFTKREVDLKTQELVTHAFHLARKNEILERLKMTATDSKASEKFEKGLDTLVRAIDQDLQSEDYWESFSRYFDDVHLGFKEKSLQQYPNLTPNELRLMSLIMLNLSTKEVANILNISVAGVKKARQRLRKKMNLHTSASLENAVWKIKNV